MPQFYPSYVNIPDKIRENPESFGLIEEDLRGVDSCNQVASQLGSFPGTVMLTSGQWNSYRRAVEIIKRFEERNEWKKIEQILSPEIKELKKKEKE